MNGRLAVEATQDHLGLHLQYLSPQCSPASPSTLSNVLSGYYFFLGSSVYGLYQELATLLEYSHIVIGDIFLLKPLTVKTFADDTHKYP